MDTGGPSTSTTSTTERRRVHTATGGDDESEDTIESTGHAGEGAAKPAGTTEVKAKTAHDGDNKPLTVELELGKKMRQLLHGIAPATRQPRFPLQQHLHVALQLLSLLPNMLDVIVESHRKAEQTSDPALFSADDKTLLQAMTNAFAFNSSDDRLQNMAMADLLITLLFLDGKVQTVATTLAEILKQLEGMTGDCRLPQHIRDLFLGKPLRREEEYMASVVDTWCLS
ncbi:uncharacterized protein [Branchiostoma lanceolatum]|uniref:uncharacterized protein n=1 Tax=Branchiostoma lanceolatum TaxID=7740 RepID=UPI003451DA8D